MHANYPHEPGRLPGCPECDWHCHCGPGVAAGTETQCVALVHEEHSADEPVSMCPACGSVIDYCQGHGEMGDPAGRAVLDAHEQGDHSTCHPDAMASGACEGT